MLDGAINRRHRFFLGGGEPKPINAEGLEYERRGEVVVKGGVTTLAENVF